VGGKVLLCSAPEKSDSEREEKKIDRDSMDKNSVLCLQLLICDLRSIPLSQTRTNRVDIGLSVVALPSWDHGLDFIYVYCGEVGVCVQLSGKHRLRDFHFDPLIALLIIKFPSNNLLA
jgi:hypothetical protein